MKPNARELSAGRTATLDMTPKFPIATRIAEL
jgi:hypothetical protein